MRTSLLALLTLGIAATGIAVTACSVDPTQPGPAATLGGAPAVDPVDEPVVVQSVTGNGHFVSPDADRRSRTATFSMRKYSDGSVSGWYHALGRGSGGANIRVRIECLHIAGNQAWASGTVVSAVDPGNVGRPYSIRFVDNGQGAGASPDEIGVARFVESDCATEPDIPLRQLTVGNLQIRE